MLPPGDQPKPDASNTGVPAGTTLTSSGSLTASTPGQLVNALDITGSVTVTANNVTIQNCRITVDGYYGVYLDQGATGVTLKNCEIIGDAAGPQYIGATGGGCTLDACYLRGLENPITLTDGNAVVKNCFIERLEGAPGAHFDGIEVYAGSNYQIINNNIRMTDASGNWLSDTGAINIASTWSNIANVLVDHNWLGGGSYTLTLDEQGGFTITGLTVTNNRWYGSAPRGYAAYGPIRSEHLITTYTNNVWDDTGSPL